MRELGRLALLLLLAVLGLLSYGVVRYNEQIVLIEAGVFDLPRWPVGRLVVGALWVGIVGSGLLALVPLVRARLRVSKLRKERRALEDELRRARSLPLEVRSRRGELEEPQP